MTVPAKRTICVFMFALFSNVSSGSQSSDSAGTFHFGLTFRKMAGFYTLNGVCGEFRPRSFFNGRFRGGINLTTSVFGTALIGNAIPVYCYEIYGLYMLRKTGFVRPFVTVGGGYAYASYDAAFRGHIPAAQPLVAPELGMVFHPRFPVDAHFSLGYNLITGNGHRGLGVIYPLYFQLRTLIRI